MIGEWNTIFSESLIDLLNRRDAMAMFAEWNPAPFLSISNDLIIQVSNQAAKDVFCKSPCDNHEYVCICEEGKHLFQFLPVLDQNPDFLSWWVENTGNKENFQIEIKTDKKEFNLVFCKIPGIGIHIYGSDITVLKLNMRLREDIENIVKHDLKNPLTGIIGLSEMLALEVENRDHKTTLDLIWESGLKMLSMLNHSLDLHKMVEGIYQIKKENIDLIQLVINIQKQFTKLINNKNLKIVFYIEEILVTFNDMVLIEGEKCYLEIMFENLIKNAIEASPPNNLITIQFFKGKDKSYITIHNFGEIPEQIKATFFERYASSGKNNGTGLGTYSAQLIAKAHGGVITFSSSDKTGTTLKVLLNNSI